MSKIYNLLESLKLTSKETSELFSKSTRDNDNLNVYKDSLSDVIYIKDFFVGDDEYNKGVYRKKQSTSSVASLEDIADCDRRIEHFYDLYNEKIICDFGCGAGSFLLKSIDKTKQSYGVELQEDYRNNLNNMNVECTTNISEIPDGLDTCFLFHVLEHLEDPIKHLNEIKSKLANKGKVVIEVPHARDFLIKKAKVKEFIKFTLWSQHLILHTRESLYSLLEESGYKNIDIYGVQRYSLANHIQWIKDKKPGGHRGDLKDIETREIKNAYQDALNKIDATDTLIAIAEKS